MGKNNPFWTGRKATFILLLEIVLFTRHDFLEAMGALSYIGVPFIILGFVPFSIFMAVINRIKMNKPIEFKKEMKSPWNLLVLTPLLILYPEYSTVFSNERNIKSELKRYYGKEFIIEKWADKKEKIVNVYTADLPEIKAEINLKLPQPNYWDYQVAYTENELWRLLDEKLNEQEFKGIKERNEIESKNYAKYGRRFYPTINIFADNKPQGRLLNISEISFLKGDFSLEISINFEKRDLDEDAKFILLYMKYLRNIPIKTKLEVSFKSSYLLIDVDDENITYETIKNEIKMYY